MRRRDSIPTRLPSPGCSHLFTDIHSKYMRNTMENAREPVRENRGKSFLYNTEKKNELKKMTQHSNKGDRPKYFYLRKWKQPNWIEKKRGPRSSVWDEREERRRWRSMASTGRGGKKNIWGRRVRENIEKNCIQKTIQQDDWFYSVGPWVCFSSAAPFLPDIPTNMRPEIAPVIPSIV